MLCRTAVFLVTLSVSAAVPAQTDAGGMDMAKMQKWGAARVLHYKVEATYAGDATAITTDRASLAAVHDGFSFDFDWDPRRQAVVRTGTIVNRDSEVGTARDATSNCPAPKITGRYEHFTLRELRPFDAGGVTLPGTLALSGVRHFAAGVRLCSAHAGGDQSPDKDEDTDLELAVPNPVMLAMPLPTSGSGLTASQDGSGFVITDKGWRFEIVPSVLE